MYRCGSARNVTRACSVRAVHSRVNAVQVQCQRRMRANMRGRGGWVSAWLFARVRACVFVPVSRHVHVSQSRLTSLEARLVRAPAVERDHGRGTTQPSAVSSFYSPSEVRGVSAAVAIHGIPHCTPGVRGGGGGREYGVALL